MSECYGRGKNPKSQASTGLGDLLISGLTVSNFRVPIPVLKGLKGAQAAFTTHWFVPVKCMDEEDVLHIGTFRQLV